MLIICDIDGTLADIRPRLKKAGSCPDKKDKAAFQLWLDRLQPEAAMRKDPPIQATIDIIKLLAKKRDTKLVYLTGRSECYRKVTLSWLKKHKCPRALLIMRPNNNWWTAKKYKLSEMKKLVDMKAPQDVVIFDDDGGGDCAAMYRRQGWFHYHVKL